MSKEYWQLKYLVEPTPCFKKAGSTPCEASGCSVLDRIDGLRKDGVEIDSWWVYILSHSACRISVLSPDNQEYLLRLQKLKKF